MKSNPAWALWLVASSICACSSGGGSGSAAPDGGKGGSGGGSGGTTTTKYSLKAAASECKAGGVIKYTRESGSGEKRVVQFEGNAGESITLEAIPDPGSVFRGWTGDCSGSEVCVLNMDAAKDVVAEFGPAMSEAKAWSFAVNDQNATAQRVAFAPDGRIAVAITFTGQADLGGGNLLTAASGSAIVVYAADGALIWSKLWAAHEWDVESLRFVASDLVAVGTRLKKWSMDGFELDGVYRDAMFVRMDAASGTVEAAINATPTSSESVRLAAISPAGKIAIVGDFDGTANLGGADLIADDVDSTNEYLASFDADFSHAWSSAISGQNTFSETLGLDVNDSGGVALGGSVQSTLALPGKVLSNTADSESPFIATFDSTGTLGYATLFAAPSSSNQAEAVRFAENGDLLVAFYVSPAIDLGKGPLEPGTTTTARADLALGRFDPAGSVIWNRRIASDGLESSFLLAVNGDALTIAGELSAQNDGADVGTGIVYTAGIDAFVARFSAIDGTSQWLRHFGCSEWDHARFVTAHGDRTCFVGSFKGDIEYGGSTPLSGDNHQPLICFTP